MHLSTPDKARKNAGWGRIFMKIVKWRRSFSTGQELLDIDMKALCFEENDRLDLTEYTQAALVTTCLAMTRVVTEKGLKPDVTAGLSLGEYCAVSAAGGMSEEDAIKLVRKRGILMQNTVPAGEGAMAAILGMTGEAIVKS